MDPLGSGSQSDESSFFGLFTRGVPSLSRTLFSFWCFEIETSGAMVRALLAQTIAAGGQGQRNDMSSTLIPLPPSSRGRPDSWG